MGVLGQLTSSSPLSTGSARRSTAGSPESPSKRPGRQPGHGGGRASAPVTTPSRSRGPHPGHCGPTTPGEQRTPVGPRPCQGRRWRVVGSLCLCFAWRSRDKAPAPGHVRPRRNPGLSGVRYLPASDILPTERTNGTTHPPGGHPLDVGPLRCRHQQGQPRIDPTPPPRSSGRLAPVPRRTAKRPFGVAAVRAGSVAMIVGEFEASIIVLAILGGTSTGIRLCVCRTARRERHPPSRPPTRCATTPHQALADQSTATDRRVT